MELTTKLKRILQEKAGDIKALDVAIGLGYTAVMLEDGKAGVAYTFRDMAVGGCSVFNGVRPLAGSSANSLLAMVDSSDVVEAAVGLACANALVSRDTLKGTLGDVLERLDVKPGDEVGMVGNFAPLIPGLKKMGAKVSVFERITVPQNGLLPQDQAPKILPKCKIALLSSTTLLNKTLMPLLDASKNCDEVVLVGATTPLVPELFQDTPVTMISGVRVTDGPKVVQVCKEAGGMRQFKGMVEKVSLSLK